MHATRKGRTIPGVIAAAAGTAILAGVWAFLAGGCGADVERQGQATQTDRQAGPLGRLRGQKRIVLLFAPDESDRAFRQQMEWFAGRRVDLRERDIAVVELPTTGTARIDAEPIPADISQRLRERFEAPADGFTLILIDKQGWPVLRSLAPIPPYEIFEIIDAVQASE